MRIALGSDHGGFALKNKILEFLSGRGFEVKDFGCHSVDSCDYPDFAEGVAVSILSGESNEGILICSSGIGMSIAANRHDGIRAALCASPELAMMARSHNDANVLVLGSKMLNQGQSMDIVEAWFSSRFSGEDRHIRRIGKIDGTAAQCREFEAVASCDPEIYDSLKMEVLRQEENINLIASENYVSPAVRQAQGSAMTNKYAEGYPGKRYYNGCQHVDRAEDLAIERAKELFGAEHVNVQPHCGSSANMAVYFSVLQPGATILAMSLAHGGHLTHGHNVNFSGRFFKIVPYGVSRNSELLDYDEIEQLALEHKPALIIAGASAYPRQLDFQRFRSIADRAGAMLMVDMAHIAGLVAAGVHSDPVPLADFVTTTTHKTLRGPRSGMILCREKYAKDIDKTVFPGLQGGPLMHTIAAKAVCFHEALQPAFRDYASQIVRNARALAETISSGGLRLVSGGTDNHLMLIDVTSVGTTGKDAAAALDSAGIIVNKNSIPFDSQSPFVTSGIRIGTPAATTRGMKEPQMQQIGDMIVRIIRNIGDSDVEAQVRAEAAALTQAFPAP